MLKMLRLHVMQAASKLGPRRYIVPGGDTCGRSYHDSYLQSF